MTRNEFMTRLENELRKRNVPDPEDVTQEYEQHFAFKLADGYSEEETAAKLGSPEALAEAFLPGAGGCDDATVAALRLMSLTSVT